MVKIDVDKYLKSDESYYSFVIGVAKRAREITEEQLHKMKDLSEQEKTKNTVIDRTKQLPEELSTKPVRLAIEDIKAGRCKLNIESVEEVLEREEQERILKLMEHQRALEGISEADLAGEEAPSEQPEEALREEDSPEEGPVPEEAQGMEDLPEESDGQDDEDVF